MPKAKFKISGHIFVVVPVLVVGGHYPFSNITLFTVSGIFDIRNAQNFALRLIHLATYTD